MRLTVLGAGTGVPQRNRSAPATLVRAGRTAVMVDLGSGAVQSALVRCGIGPSRIDAVLLTHLHLDHCADLAPLLFALGAARAGRVSSLTLLGPDGLAGYLGALRSLYGRWIEPQGYDLKLLEWAGRHAVLGDVSVDARPTAHGVVNLAYRLTSLETGRSCLLTGDGQTTPEVERMGAGVELVVAECSLRPGEAGAGHMNPAQAARLAAACGARTLILNHLNPDCTDEEAIREASCWFDGRILAAQDGLEWP